MKLNSALRKRHLYFHRNSKEEKTGVVKPKYKLLVFMNKDLDMCIFLPGTSHEYALDKKYSVTVCKEDWEYIDAKHSVLNNDGYYSWSDSIDHKHAFCSKFPHVATMTIEKFKQILEVASEIESVPYKKSLKLSTLATTTDYSVARERAKLLGLT